VFNVDEMGDSDHDDQWELIVLIPFTCEANFVPALVMGHMKRSTVAADNFRMHSFVIVDCIQVNNELTYSDDDESNVMVVSQDTAFMTSVLFEAWSEHVLPPAVQKDCDS
jgi:hypothetical protein